jgi:hypothetical protein
MPTSSWAWEGRKIDVHEEESQITRDGARAIHAHEDVGMPPGKIVGPMVFHTRAIGYRENRRSIHSGVKAASSATTSSAPASRS